MAYSVIKNTTLVESAVKSKQGRQFWTGSLIEDAVAHLETYPNDVCMVRYGKDMKVLLGGPIPEGTLVDVTDQTFDDLADYFDVGQMTSLVQAWFEKEHDKQVSVNILGSGETTILGPNSKLITLSRKTPALLDMAATENGDDIGQYCNRILGHSGDLNSTIGDVPCLHHELTVKPSVAGGIKLYFLVGYNNKPLKAWRDSRVFWILYDADQEACWLIPHDLSHKAVGDTISATMALLSRSNKDKGDDTISVIHLSTPVQASLNNASPLQPSRTNNPHLAFMQQCMAEARSVDWEEAAVKPSPSKDCSNIFLEEQKTDDVGKYNATTAVDRTVAVFDNCNDEIFDNYPRVRITGKGGDSLSPMHGPLKVLARGCCANSRVVLMNGTSTCTSSEIASVSKQLSGIIFVKVSVNDPDIYKNHQVRWNMSRAARTPVIALTPDGFKHLCGPMPSVYQDEDHPTPVAGTPISMDHVQQLVEFALSDEGDDYFGPLYQAAPDCYQAQQAISDFIAKMKLKDFTVINDEDPEESNQFTDNDFRQLMETISILSVSSSTAVERNTQAIRLVKFLKKMSKETATSKIASSNAIAKHASDLEVLRGWSGENLNWAMENKSRLEEILRDASVKIEAMEGVEMDLGLRAKLDGAIKKKIAQLNKTIRTSKISMQASWKKIFNAIFNPALEYLMRCIGDNPRYLNYFPEVNNPNMSGVIIRASQSTAKQTVASNPANVMKIFHKMGATGFVSFKINFLQTWKTKVINEVCLVDQPGEGFNDPKTFVPVSHRLEDGPADPVAAYETDVRHMFILPVFPRLPKMIDEDDDDGDFDNEDDDFLKQMPAVPMEEDLAKHLLLRAEFMLRDPDQGPRHPLWQYVDWLFHQIKTVHQVHERQAAPLAMRALGFSISRLMDEKPNPDKPTMETVASIIHAINFMSARGDPIPHGIIDTFFNMGSKYVPLTKDVERDPWQVEVVNILSRAVDYVRPLMSAEEYAQIRSNFQRAAANMVKRQLVQKLLDDLREEKKKNAESQSDYLLRVNNEFYPAYRETVETLQMLLEADPTSFQLTDKLCVRIDALYQTIAVNWAKDMRRCRVGPVREMVKALKSMKEAGHEAISYLVSRRPFLTILYDQVYHIKYEACDHVMVEEVCNIIKAKTRNPNHEKHEKWLDRLDRAIQDVSSYDTRMKGFAHGNRYKELPTELLLKILRSLEADPASDDAVSFDDVKSLLAHVNIEVVKPADLKHKPDLRAAWWMCPDVSFEATAKENNDNQVPTVALISVGETVGMAASSTILAKLGDIYHRHKLARLFSGSLRPMRNFIRENYKFHLEWFEETIQAAGIPQHFDLALVKDNEVLAIYAIVQRLVHELVEDEEDRGDRARNRVYGQVADPFLARVALET